MILPAWVLTLIGVGLCLPLLLVLSAWSAQAWWSAALVRRQFLEWQRGMRSELDRRDSGSRQRSSDLAIEPAGWKGWRRFRVREMRRETENATSLWLEPVDGLPVAPFAAGQYLTLRVQAGARDKPKVRCYSISGPIVENGYQLTVKSVPAGPDMSDRVSVSQWIQNGMMAGDLVEARSPAGDFVLDGNSPAPLVLLAAGVGITPIAAMIQHLTATRSPRSVLLLYGNRNSGQHIFRRSLEEAARQNPRLSVVNCYSAPLPGDEPGRDYQAGGHVTIELVRKLLPHQKFQFYLCGPAAFIQSLHRGLQEWGVPEGRIFLEAFGPASLPQTAPAGAVDGTPQPKLPTQSVPVSFAASSRQVECEDVERSILDLAESISVEIASGCRAGSCGTCAIRLLKGKVRYPDQPSAPIEPGFCLACIAHPEGPVEVEA